MKAVETNVVLRFLAQDDPVQAPIATALILAGVFIPSTVILETAWVLRSRYRLSRDEICGGLRNLLLLAGVVTPYRDRVLWALDRHEAGADFPDMLHVAVAGDVEVLLTFDKKAARDATVDGPIPVEQLR